jgi:hypothetical protein
MGSDITGRLSLSIVSASSLEMAAARAVGRGAPLDTFDLLAALVGQDVVGGWSQLQLATTFIEPDEADQYGDPIESGGGSWRNVPLTPAASRALAMAAELADAYQITPVPPGLIALGAVWDPDSGAARALLAESPVGHPVLLELVQDEILGTRLEGLDAAASRVPQPRPATVPPLERPLGGGPQRVDTAAREPVTGCGQDTVVEGGEGPTDFRPQEMPPHLAGLLGVAPGELEVLGTPAAADEPWVVAAGVRVVKAYDPGGLSESREQSLRAQPAIARALGPGAAIVPITSITDAQRWLTIEQPRMRQSLRTHIDESTRGRQPRWSSVRYADELLRISQTLQRLHDLDLVHDDVRPEALLEEPGTGRLALADYAANLGAEISSVPETAEGEAETPLPRRLRDRVPRARHVAPERLVGETGPAVDQYALGVVALDVFTARGAPPVTAPVHAVLTRATSPRPADRFASIAEYGQALRDAVRVEAPRGLADRIEAIPAYQRATFGPVLVATAAGVYTAIHEAMTVPGAAATEPIAGVLAIVTFAFCAWLPIMLAGMIRGRRTRLTLDWAAGPWVPATVVAVGAIASLALRPNPTAWSVVMLPLVVVYVARALSAPAPDDAGAFGPRAARAWDRLAAGSGRVRSIAAAGVAALVLSALFAPTLVANVWPANQPTMSVRDFGSLVAIWNLRAYAGSDRAALACDTTVAFPPSSKTASCRDIVLAAGAVERTDPVSRWHGPVFGRDFAALARFRVAAIPAPTGSQMWELRLAGTNLVAGAFYTEKDTHPHVYAMLSREAPAAESGRPRLYWGYDVERLGHTWKITSVAACRLVAPGGGMQPATCLLRSDAPAQFAHQILAAVAKARDQHP